MGSRSCFDGIVLKQLVRSVPSPPQNQSSCAENNGNFHCWPTCQCDPLAPAQACLRSHWSRNQRRALICTLSSVALPQWDFYFTTGVKGLDEILWKKQSHSQSRFPQWLPVVTHVHTVSELEGQILSSTLGKLLLVLRSMLTAEQHWHLHFGSSEDTFSAQPEKEKFTTGWRTLHSPQITDS